jgi:phosphatidyl-myo-inositol dimannoside synthase
MTGGIQLVMQRLVEGLTTFDTRVVTEGVPRAAEFDERLAYEVVRVAQRRERNRIAVLRLNARGFREGVRRPPDVLISGHVVAAPATSALRRLIRRPSLQYVHAEEFRDRPGVSAFAVRAADAVVAVSRYSSDLALGAGADPRRVHCVNLGVDPNSRPKGERAPRPTIITVARLQHPEKGHDVVMRAMPLILKRVPDAQWMVIGEGPLRPELEGSARQLGVADAVHFLGQVSDAERNAWLARSHVFVLPNRAGEGFGIVFLEAASHGLPVVAGAVGGALDAVVDGQTGLLVEATDPNAVGDAVVELLLDPARSVQMGSAGERRAREFSWARHVESVERVLTELCAERARRVVDGVSPDPQARRAPR